MLSLSFNLSWIFLKDANLNLEIMEQSLNVNNTQKEMKYLYSSRLIFKFCKKGGWCRKIDIGNFTKNTLCNGNGFELFYPSHISPGWQGVIGT